MSDSPSSNGATKPLDAQTASDLLVSVAVLQLLKDEPSSPWGTVLSTHIPRMAKLGKSIDLPAAIMDDVMRKVEEARRKSR